MHVHRGLRVAHRLAVLAASCACALLASGAVAAAGIVQASARLNSNSANHHRRTPKFVDPLQTSAIRAYLHSRTGDIAIGVENLRTDRTYLWNGGSEQDTASIVKVDILETLLYQLHGRPIPRADVPTAVAMIEDSDNDDATALWNLDGGAPGVAAFDRRVGMRQTTPNVAWGLTTTTVGDQLKLLDELLKSHALIGQAAQRFALGLMENVTPSQTWGVSGGVPSGESIALKNGWLPFGGGWHINSIGRIRGGGRWYLIAMLTSDNPSETYGVDTVNAISSLVWRALAPVSRGVLGGHSRSLGRGRYSSSGSSSNEALMCSDRASAAARCAASRSWSS
jgi:beta-lactamase class A